MSDHDPHDLERFIEAQHSNYGDALRELRRGRKQSHWIWYVFPQVAGLGFSPMAEKYAIRSESEAVAYLDHEILGSRLRECSEAILSHRNRRIRDIMGSPDDLKLCSSMTLFARVSANDTVFQNVLDAFYSGKEDPKTVVFLESRQTDET